MNQISSEDKNDISRTLYNFAKKIETDKKFQDEIWENFCMSEKKDVALKKTNFSKHPESLSSGSELSDVSLGNKKDEFVMSSEIINCHVKFKNDSYLQNMHATDETRKFMEKYHDFKIIDKKEFVIKESVATLHNVNETNNSCIKSASVNNKQTHKTVPSKVSDKIVYVEEMEEKAIEKNQSLDLLEEPNRKESLQKKQNSSNIYSFENYEEKKKMKIFLQKCIDSLELIRKLMDKGVEPPDGDEDYSRRKKRCVEFSSRFSRNYLYQLDRLISELSMKRKSSVSKIPANKIPIAQKILNSQNLVLQALTAYHNHMPSSVTCGIPNKLKELLERTMQINEIHIKHLKNDEHKDVLTHVEEFQNKSKSLICTLSRSKTSLKESGSVKLKGNQSTANNVRSSLMKTCSDVPFHKQNSLNSRLSVYGTTPSIQLKKSIATLAKHHNFAQSRYKTATFKHRPLLDNEKIPELNTSRRFPIDRAISLTKSISSPIPCPINEDDIPTMVQMDKCEETEKRDSIKNDVVKDINDIIPLAQELCTRICRMNQDKVLSQDELEKAIKNVVQNTMLPGKCSSSTTSLCETHPISGRAMHACASTGKLSSSKKNDDGESEKNANEPQRSEIQCQNDMPQEDHACHRKLKKKEKLTVIGPKNVQLICINADPSKEISFREEDRSVNHGCLKTQNFSVQNFTVSEAPPEKLASATCNNVTSEQNLLPIVPVPSQSVESLSRLSINRLPKKDKRVPLSLLPKKCIFRIVEYHMKFRECTKTNPMYSTVNRIKPWHILDSISDKLLDDVLLSIVQDMSVQNVVLTLYNSEFK